VLRVDRRTVWPAANGAGLSIAGRAAPVMAGGAEAAQVRHLVMPTLAPRHDVVGVGAGLVAPWRAAYRIAAQAGGTQPLPSLRLIEGSARP